VATNRPVRTAALILGAALALAGCGVDSGTDAVASSTTAAPATSTSAPRTTAPDTTAGSTSPETTSTTAPSGSSTTLPGILGSQTYDEFVQGFVDSGLTKTQATCLADAFIQLYGSGDPSSFDTGALLSLYSGCGLSASDIPDSTPGG
jgi:hypothetical protein